MDFWLELINRPATGGTIEFLLGTDLGDNLFEPCGFIYRRFEVGPRKGVIGVIGPARVNYNRIFPTIKYFGELIDEMFKGW